MHELQCIWPVATELGEGPVWVEREQALYFVDIMGHAIHRWRVGGETRSWPAPAEPGFIVPNRDGGFICGLRGGLHRFDAGTGAFALMTPVEQDRPRHRLNDGFVDATGRLWFGTMNDDCRTVGGALYSLEKDWTPRVHDAGYIVTNGPVTSPDGSRLYHTDSAAHAVYVFDLAANGRLTNKRLFARFPEDIYPDGMAVDQAGHLWIALFNGWRVERYTPQGDKAGEVRLPCANVTKPAFGGPAMRTLYVTTAWTSLTPQARANQPLAGGVFSVVVATPGLTPAEADYR